VQQIKPFRVKLNEQSDDGNAQNVKNINAYPPQWNKPTLLLELSKRQQNNPKPNEGLFKRGATPDNMSSRARVEAYRVLSNQVSCTPYTTYYPKNGARDVMTHGVKKTGEIDAKPRYKVVIFFAYHCPLPKIISRQQHHNET
jgi:hypothetical protein